MITHLATKGLLIILLLISIYGQGQNKGYALLVGANISFDPIKYSSASVAKANSDADLMKDLLQEAGFQSQDIVTLNGKDANAKAVLKSLTDFSKKVKEGDMFVFYFSGHGGTLADRNGDELPYPFDQELILADGTIPDDDLFNLFRAFPESSRLVTIIDACFSGEMYKFLERFLISLETGMQLHGSEPAFGLADLDNGCPVKTDLQPFDMIYVGAVDKNRLSIANPDGSGKLTQWINSTWRYMKLSHYLESYPMLDFFRQACSSNTETIITKIQRGQQDIFGTKYAFKL